MVKLNSGLPALILFVFGLVGLLVSAVVQMGFDNGFLVSPVLESQVSSLQIMIIVMFLIFGSIAAALYSK